MGAYLSEPIVEKNSTDEIGEHMSYGASSMQGWRVSQEDAHNHILSYDGGKSLFAVYDGHGGHEVAEYCSKYLPDYIKKNENYKTGNYEKALVDSFIGFDATLVDRKVVAELKLINGSSDDKEEDEQEVNHLCEEASMPIEDVIAKYSNENGGESNGTIDASPAENGSGSGGEPSKPLVNPALAGLRDGDKKKPISPFLRAKSSSMGEGSSGLNKHIRFNEEGDEIKENGEKKGEASTGEETAKEANTSEEEKSSDTKKDVCVNGDEDASENKENKAASTESIKNEEQSVKKEEESSATLNGGTDDASSEKENKDTNGTTTTTAVVTKTVVDLKGKGKGKGKGKSSQVVKSSQIDIEMTEEQIMDVKEKKQKRTAHEIYSSLLKTSPESDDEESEDSEDEEFGAEVDSESDSEEECMDEDVDLEGEEGELEDEEEDSDMEEEEEEDEDGFIEADFTEEPGNDSGCTAVLALLTGTKLYVANAGDSRCVVCRDGKALEMSLDHKPEDEIELTRIKGAGGKVTPDGRVNGGLNLSRAIGDHAYKQNKTLPLKDQMISSQPDIKELDIDPVKDSWMILACDGIWNSMSSEEVVQFVNERIQGTDEGKLSSICEELFDHCLADDTLGDGTGCDNMTAVIVKFKPSLAKCKDVISASQTNGEAGGSSSSSSTVTSTSKGPAAPAPSSAPSSTSSTSNQEGATSAPESATSDTGSNSKADSTADSTTTAATNSSESTVEPEAKRMKLSAE